MNRSRGKILFLMLIVVLMGALSACSTSGSKETSGNASSEPTTTAQTEKEIIVKHAMGEEKLKGIPQRVVVLDNGALDNLLALGVKPVGAPTVQLEEPYPAYLRSQAEGITNIGTIDEPNLETIASLKPDLILGSKDTHEKIFEKLKRLAPTVYVESLGYTWKDNLKVQAAALGKEAEADKLLSAYTDRLAQFKDQMGDRLANTTVSVLRPRTDHVRIYLRQSFSGIIVEDAGLKRPATQQADEFASKATEEQVANMDGDVILWFSRDTDNLLESKLANNPLWKNLKAVKDKKVFKVDADLWLSGLGIQAANLVVDDLFKIFVSK
ncbi:iron-siderophore ABC transporter substrate-binding protein [Paenibacillus zeisoli]|uniref:Iron-siderophore ABC transporter substrate-binding protein n=1 Tax=Paenibacillus zeisoli TaxID=2496267 RepID=A0A3S1D9Q1_9BACL|nr:iron-siderophore ABC transporter substrate-binding protein [Paenibacillus zeisoli]RUT35896.1 iron-siderophore ABC transporter substrate-binding protein [Paenibacillus zeisoli]